VFVLLAVLVSQIQEQVVQVVQCVEELVRDLGGWWVVGLIGDAGEQEVFELVGEKRVGLLLDGVDERVEGLWAEQVVIHDSYL